MKKRSLNESEVRTIVKRLYLYSAAIILNALFWWAVDTPMYAEQKTEGAKPTTSGPIGPHPWTSPAAKK